MTTRRENWWRMRGTLCVLLFSLLAATPTLALTDPSKYPRLGNYYLRAGIDITPQTIPLLLRYDLLVLPAEAQIQNPDLFAELRRRNPDIVILAYVPTLSFNHRFWRDELHRKLLAGIRDEWWLRDPSGNRISFWPGTEALNLTSGWTEYLARFVRDEIRGSGKWDGIFYDEVDDCIACRERNVDTDRNGAPDDPRRADAAWVQGYQRLFSLSRSLEGPSRIIIINGSSTPAYQPHVNGRMFESFPTPWEGAGRWEDTMRSYARLEETVGGRPPFFFLDGDTANTGVTSDWRDVRFGLTSTLLGGGYFGYSHGTENHGQLWWFDEYEVFLGRPRGAPRDLKNSGNAALAPSVWRRDFEKGIVLVNAGNAPESVSLREDFEKVHGVQDPATNDGAIVSRVKLPPSDGLVLLRISEEVLSTAFPNGAFSRIFKGDGTVVRTGFFLYDARFRGGRRVIRTDLEGDGSTEAIVASEGRVEIWNEDGRRRLVFAPYGEGYLGEVTIAIGDLDGNGTRDIVTGAGPGGGPHVRSWRSDGRLLHPGFFAFDKNFRGGVEVAVGDIDGDRIDEIIAGPGIGLSPQVRVFRRDGTVVHQGFFAYAPTFRGGVNVAAGDLDGDGTAEIITGAGRTGGPHVRIWNGSGVSQGRGFFAYDPNRRDGVRVGATDLDGDGRAEILALTTEVVP